MAGRVTKGDLLRQRIVEASLKLFADQGFRATTVQQIADEVGISKQRLLYHFSSKEELHRAVLEGVAFSVRRVLDRLPQGKARPERIVAASGGAKSALWLTCAISAERESTLRML